MKIIESYKNAFKVVYNFTKSDIFKAVCAIMLFAILFLASIIVPMFFTKSVLVWIGMVLCLNVIFLPIYVKCYDIADSL